MADGKRFYEILIILHLILAIIQFLFFQPVNPLSPETPKALLVLLANLVIFLVCYFIFLKWVSLFVLPANDSCTRHNVYERLVEYIFGLHGLVVFVKNGELLTRKDERPDNTGIKARFASLAFVDLTSAIVLESKDLIHPLKSIHSSGPWALVFVFYTLEKEFEARLTYASSFA
jgi:hypothetical protein